MKKQLLLNSIRLYFQSVGRLAPRHASRLATRLFTTPRQRPAIKPEYQSWVDTATSISIEIQGITLKGYDWGGDGPIALLLHGWESRAARMSVLLPVLQQHGYRAIAFDAPAHGDSSGGYLHVPLYANVLTELIARYQPSLVAGHSMGALASLYAFAHLGAASGVNHFLGIGVADDPEKIINDAAHTLRVPGNAMVHFVAGFKTLTRNIALPDLNKSALVALCPSHVQMAFVHAHDDAVAGIDCGVSGHPSGAGCADYGVGRVSWSNQELHAGDTRGDLP
jgi:pimeloyl-ACP methyl ester carboxylesterase